MTLVVPFDGSELSRAALVRAVQFDRVLEEGVDAVAVVPRRNPTYARQKGWIEAGEPFDAEAVLADLREAVADPAPGATFEGLLVDRHAPAGAVAAELRRFARERDASIVFVGSENAGRVVRSITTGGSVAGDRAYDTMIVSHVAPTPVERLRDADPSAGEG